VAGNDHVAGTERHVGDGRVDRPDPIAQPGPLVDQRLLQPRRGRRYGGVCRQRDRCRVVEQHHHVREQAVAGREIHHPTAAKQAASATGHFPGLVEFLARQHPGTAYRPGYPVEQRHACEPPEVLLGQA